MTSNKGNKELKKILIISSRPPLYSAGLGQDIMDALIENNKEVDFVSISELRNQPINYIRIKKSFIDYFKTKVSIIKSIFIHCFRLKYLAKIILSKPFYICNNDIVIKYPFEDYPTVPINNVLKSITKKYDLIITLFWQDMLTSQTLKALYNKTHLPILIYSPDMAPITGGCFYFGECKGYTRGCGKCPALNSVELSDLSSRNFKIKKENYSKINVSFCGNTWMINHVIKSTLFPKDRIFKTEIIVNNDIFKPIDKFLVRKQLGIDFDKFIIMLRSTEDYRKGNNDIKKAIDIFYNKVPTVEKEKICVLTVGDNYFSNLQKKNTYNIINLGLVNRDMLIKAYNASNLFINASIDDAGPSMINQSLMCGTPVVAYNTGTALDVLEDNISGFCSPVGDYHSLANNITTIFNLTDYQTEELRNSTLKMAILHNSKQTFAKKIEEIWNIIQS